jgi:hypothetical protein
MSLSRLLIGGLFVASVGFSSPAMAHIRLSEPIARYEITGSDTGIKGCPCGLATGGGNSNRTCNVELDGSDPARNEDRASTFVAGATIKLKFDEYMGHAGRYRVAFDPEGADFDDFNTNVLHDETDPNGNEGNIGDGSKWEIEVTLPDVECDNCTLQLLQVMAGGTENPVDASNLATLSTYYTCIDLKLTAPEGNTTEESSAAGTAETETSATSSAQSTTDVDATSSTTLDISDEDTELVTTSPPDDETTTASATMSTAATSAGVAPPITSAVPSLAPTSSASPTSPTSSTPSTMAATNTTAAPSGTDDGGAGTASHEGGCAVVGHRGISSAFPALLGLVIGALLRRRTRNA